MNFDSPKRCPWCGSNELYVRYHDEEWGKLMTSDKMLFEFLILEGAQAGLSWFTILKRRENYRAAFAEFDPYLVSKFNAEDVHRLMQNSGIIRNRLKIKSAINNATLFLLIEHEFGSFFNYILSFFPNQKPLINHPTTLADVPVTSFISDHLSKDMKKRGFTFFGSTICYSFLQATGFIDDHLETCDFKQKKMKNPEDSAILKNQRLS